MFHMVWTIAWNDHGIGVAHSRDLIHWSRTRVPVMEHEPTALNAWAPDLFYDDAERGVRHCLGHVHSRAVPGDRLARTGDDPRARRPSALLRDHERDFKTYTKAELLYDGGFPVIDGDHRREGGRATPW